MVYVFLANGFEEIEALTPVDLLRRAGVEVTTVGVGGDHITGAHGITVKADISDSLLTKQTLCDLEMAVLPGGMPGTKNLDASESVSLALEAALEKNAYIAAICAAPSVIGKRNLLNGKKATCYPGFEAELHGATLCDAPVTVDGKIICGKAAGCAVSFALALVCALKGEDTAERIRADIFA